VRRHEAAHLPAKLVRAAEAAEMTEADDLLGVARRVQREVLEVLEGAKRQGNLGGVLQAADQVQKSVALLATLLERGVGEGREWVLSWASCPHHPKGCPPDA